MSIKILAVDDSKVSRLMIKAFFLEINPNFQIDEAANGQAAIDKCLENKPDLITMDINMPGISGLEAAEKILAVHGDVKIAMLTANAQEAMRNRAHDLGVTFSKKPITAELIKQIAKLV